MKTALSARLSTFQNIVCFLQVEKLDLKSQSFFNPTSVAFLEDRPSMILTAVTTKISRECLPLAAR